MQRFRNAATPSSSWKKCGALFDNPDWNAIHIYIFYALKKFKWSQVSNQAALHCIGIISEREKIYWKSNALNILKTNPNKLAIVFGLQYHISYCSRGRNAAHNSLHILRMFTNAANWNYLILSITKSNFLFICVSGSIKLKQWLLYASKVLLFFHSFVMFPAFQAEFSWQKMMLMFVQCNANIGNDEWRREETWKTQWNGNHLTWTMSFCWNFNFDVLINAIQWTFRRK